MPPLQRSYNSNHHDAEQEVDASSCSPIKQPLNNKLNNKKARRDRHRKAAISSWSTSMCAENDDDVDDDVDVDDIATVATNATTITSPSTTGSVSPSITKVRFGSVQVREYSRIMGDNLNVTEGPPLAIGWSFYQHDSQSLNGYEAAKPAKAYPAPKKMPKMNSTNRRTILKWFDVSEAEIHMHEKQVKTILKEQAKQRQRANKVAEGEKSPTKSPTKGRFGKLLANTFSRSVIGVGVDGDTKSTGLPTANPLTNTTRTHTRTRPATAAAVVASTPRTVNHSTPTYGRCIDV